MGTTLQQAMCKSRNPVEGPELRLLTRLLQTTLPTDKRLARVVFREPEVPTGFPDLVIAYPSARPLVECRARLTLTARHIQLLHHLWCVRGDGLESVAKALSLRPIDVECCADNLVAADLVTRRGRFLLPKATRRTFVLRRLVAVEGKMRNWRSALQQAVANTWFASHSFIAIPPTRSLPQVKREARRHGIGVLVVNDTESTCVLSPKEHAIPASYGSWLFNEWTVQRMKQG